MSHHLDGLTAKSDTRLNISDVYLFRGDSGTVLVMNTNPLSGVGGFHPEATYDFKIDITGNAREDLTLRTTFTPVDKQGQQKATLSLLTGCGAHDRTAVAMVLAHTTTGKACTGVSGLRFWAGPAGDPFYIAAPVMSAARTAVTQGTRLDLGDFNPEHATNPFQGTNVQAIVLEVPDHILVNALTIGFWGAISIPTDAGDDWRQVNRSAIPLVGTLFGFNEADDYNATRPVDDKATWGDQIQNMITNVVEANDYDGDPQAYAEQVRNTISPEILRYTIGTDAKFTDGRHNGRNLTENAPEEMFRLVLGKSVTTGLDAGSATGAVRPDFPYLSNPA